MAEQERVGPYAEFGNWIRQAREQAKLKSQPAAVMKATRLKLGLINQGKLSHLERGLNGNPEPELLAQLSTLYDVPYVEIVSRWIAARYAATLSDDVSDLLRHGSTRQQDPRVQQGGSGGAATISVQQSIADRERAERDRANKVAEEIQDIIGRLANLRSTLVETGTPVRKKTRSRGRHRKAG